MFDNALDDAVTHERLAKAERLRAHGIEPFPHIPSTPRTEIAKLHTAHDPADLEAGEHPDFSYRLAGRVISRRGHGKTTFIDLRDFSGEIQLAVRQDTLGEEAYERIVDLDVGDIVEAEGPIYVTQRGQLALSVHRCVLLTKALRPPPDKRHGLGDTGTRYRYRELDLLANESTRELFVTRAKTVDALRAFMAERGFIEVRNARPASAGRGSIGATVSDPPQRARPGDVAAYLRRAVSQPLPDRRTGERVRPR